MALEGYALLFFIIVLPSGFVLARRWLRSGDRGVRREVESLERTPVAELRPRVRARVHGVARGVPVHDPSGEPALAWRGGGTPFEIVDETGAVTVDPSGAAFVGTRVLPGDIVEAAGLFVDGALVAPEREPLRIVHSAR